MRHTFRCPLRWADLDLLGHVNNVTYVDYLQEARVDVFRTHAPDARADDLAEGTVVVRHEVTYVSSLTFRPEPVLIDCWVSDITAATFTMDYEVYDVTDAGERVTYLRARTVLTPYVFATESPRRLRPEEKEALERLREDVPREEAPKPTEPVDVPGGLYPIQVRFSDVDVYRHVNNVKYFEYFQEARIMMMMATEMIGASSMHLVVARTDVDYRRPLLLRAEPYDCRTWIPHIGRTSVVFESIIEDQGEVMARARVVGVCMDNATGRPTPVPEEIRTALGL